MTATRTGFLARGVLEAVEAAQTEILDVFSGMEAEDQVAVDQAMIDLDGTPHRTRSGANAILGVSLTVRRRRPRRRVYRSTTTSVECRAGVCPPR